MQDTAPLVEDVMATPPVVLRTADSLWRAMDRFTATGLRFLVVLDDADAVVGLLDDRAVAAEWVGDALRMHRTTVAQVLARQPVPAASIHRGTPAHEAARALLRQQAEALPVIGDDGRVAGVVTATDLLRAVLAGASPTGQPADTRARAAVGR
jgi:CBS domain-containing protein